MKIFLFFFFFFLAKQNYILHTYFFDHFQILALQSPLPVAKIPSVPREFKETATEITELRWPCNINNGLPEAWSQKMTPRSLEPDKMYSLSGVQQTDKTKSLWPM